VPIINHPSIIVFSSANIIIIVFISYFTESVYGLWWRPRWQMVISSSSMFAYHHSCCCFVVAGCCCCWLLLLLLVVVVVVAFDARSRII